MASPPLARWASPWAAPPAVPARVKVPGTPARPLARGCDRCRTCRRDEPRAAARRRQPARRAVARAADPDLATAATDTDRAFMRRALELASRALGQTHPNPAVGCVIVSAEGEVVGEGYHPRAGMPHAEVYALRAAGQRAAGATAYVTLEPCNHFGRTPPCSRALVAAGVARVVVGVTDPNPLVGGCGIKTLQAAGIPVAVGCEEQACHDINAEFMQRMREQAAAAAADQQP